MTSFEIRDPETYAIIGAAMEVHAELGHGFLEAVYHDAMCIELQLRGIPYQREVQLPVYYKGVQVGKTFRADLICIGSIIVELKALNEIKGGDDAQLINYLKASGLHRGLLINFGAKRMQHKRMVWEYEGD